MCTERTTKVRTCTFGLSTSTIDKEARTLRPAKKVGMISRESIKEEQEHKDAIDLQVPDKLFRYLSFTTEEQKDFIALQSS